MKFSNLATKSWKLIVKLATSEVIEINLEILWINDMKRDISRSDDGT